MNPLLLLFALTFLAYVDVRILSPLLPSISASLEASPGAIGQAMTGYAITYGFGQLVYGPLSDRLGRIAVVRSAGIGFCLFTALSALSQTSGQFIALRLLAGAFTGAVVPLTMVFVGDNFAYERRQAILGRMFVISSVAIIFSAAIGGTLAHYLSWRAMLLGYALAGLIPLALLWRIESDKPVSHPGHAGLYRDFLRDRRALFTYGGVFLEGLFLWGGLTYLGSFATFRYGLDQFTVGLLIALFGVGTMAGGLLIGRINRRVSEGLQAVLGGGLMGVAFLILIPRWPPWVFAAGMLLLGLGVVGLHTTLQLRATEISATARGKAFALFAVGNFAGIAAGSAGFGWFVNAGLYEAMLLIVGIGLIATGLAMAMAPRRRVTGAAGSGASGPSPAV
jgi:predicted MFS family arabinose efflux permease